MADIGIKIGTNLNTDLDKDLAFTSKYGTLKIFKKGDISLTTDGSGNGSSYIEHGLGYAPAFLIFRKDTATWTFLDPTSYPDAYIPGVGVTNDWVTVYGINNGDLGSIHAYTTADRLYIISAGADPNRTKDFVYYLLVEKSEAFTDPDSITKNKNIGMKVAKPGKNVLTSPEYDLGYSSKYKSLQYYPESIKEETLTLPLMFSSFVDSEVEEGCYVDFFHGLGYPPLFMAYARSSLLNTDMMIEIPFAFETADGGYSSEYQISSFCDSTRIRVSFYRRDNFNYLMNTPSRTWLDEALVIKLYVFTENLAS